MAESVYRLIVNPDTEDSWEIPLLNGLTSIGRGPDNDFSIEHESVSNAHCLLTVMDSGTTVLDLGSAGGTFVNGAPVQEATLLPGETIRLGDVIMRFESKSNNPQALTVAQDVNQPCKFHPKAVACFLCAECGEMFCGLCVSRRSERGTVRNFCRVCGVECSSVQIVPHQPQAAGETFFRQISGAFCYPFKSDGLILLVGGTIFFTVLEFVATHAAVFGVVLMLAGSGYLVSYFQRILLSSACGENKMPDWPDFTNVGEFASPILQFVGTALLSFGPLIVLRIFAPQEMVWTDWKFAAAIGIGCLYFPMAFTAVTMADSFSALNPLVIIPSIFRIWREYLLVVLLSVGIVFAERLGEAFFWQLPRIPLVPGLIGEFLALYLGAVEMRLLGLIYWKNRHQLRWFSR
jgi:hypothetical protein